MAVALLDHHAQGRVNVRSTGSAPADRTNPVVVAAMEEVGLDGSKEFPKPMTDETMRAAVVVITRTSVLMIHRKFGRRCAAGTPSWPSSQPQGESAAAGRDQACFGSTGYGEDELRHLPDPATKCVPGLRQNPTAVAELIDGEVVLDSARAADDVILSARQVGPSGKAYGLDMTDEMLELTRRNAAEVAVDSVEFLKGQIEDIPLPTESVHRFRR